MNHKDHVDLLRGGVSSPEGVWADLGCGTGAFTLALANLLDAPSVIYAVDKDRRAISELKKSASDRFPLHDIRAVAGDFTLSLDMPRLDGVVMANSLHFLKDKEPIVRAVRGLLKPDGCLILIEYNVDRGNPWVPYPISFGRWVDLAARCGFGSTEKIGAKPSSFLREIYSALSPRALQGPPPRERNGEVSPVFAGERRKGRGTTVSETFLGFPHRPGASCASRRRRLLLQVAQAQAGPYQSAPVRPRPHHPALVSFGSVGSCRRWPASVGPGPATPAGGLILAGIFLFTLHHGASED